MTLASRFETACIPAHSDRTVFRAVLIGTALLATAALLLAPSAADASPRNGYGSVELVTPIGHHGSGHRRGRAHDRHYYYDRNYHDRHYNERGHPHRRVERARRYAGQATAQASTAWRSGCARSGPRWSTSWEDHYFWALKARPRELRRELNRRDDHLRECRVWHRQGYRHSRHYRPH